MQYSYLIFCLQIQVEYGDIPPQVFISRENTFFRENQPPRGFRAVVTWERAVSPEQQEQEYRLHSMIQFHQLSCYSHH